jgi:ferric-dicitrate binding protein FerR (iron transport regulator)
LNHRKKRASEASALAVLTAAALAATLLSAPGTQAAQTVSGTAATAGAPGKAKTVTLVTGDRVTLDATGQVTGVRPAKGREGTTF